MVRSGYFRTTSGICTVDTGYRAWAGYLQLTWLLHLPALRRDNGPFSPRHDLLLQGRSCFFFTSAEWSNLLLNASLLQDSLRPVGKSWTAYCSWPHGPVPPGESLPTLTSYSSLTQHRGQAVCFSSDQTNCGDHKEGGPRGHSRTICHAPRLLCASDLSDSDAVPVEPGTGTDFRQSPVHVTEHGVSEKGMGTARTRLPVRRCAHLVARLHSLE